MSRIPHVSRRSGDTSYEPSSNRVVGILSPDKVFARVAPRSGERSYELCVFTTLGETVDV